MQYRKFISSWKKHMQSKKNSQKKQESLLSEELSKNRSTLRNSKKAGVLKAIAMINALFMKKTSKHALPNPTIGVSISNAY